MAHVPVLLNEVIEYLDPRPNENFIDCTIGGGGHALGILSLTRPRGKLLGIDLSPEAIQNLQSRIHDRGLSRRLILVCDNFTNIRQIVDEYEFTPVDGIVLDLGLSSDLLEQSGRGFSFMRNETLDMRYNSEYTVITAEQIVNQYSKKELNEIFKKYGGERYSWPIAKKIAYKRKKQKIKTTQELSNIVKSALGRHFHIKSLARVFQALRIAVNNELTNLENVLVHSSDIVESGGRIAVISYHSLEDRTAKRFFKQEKILKILTKKPVTPTHGEIEKNKRARSAKLRVVQKI